MRGAPPNARLQFTVDLEPDGDTWLVVVARGKKSLADALILGSGDIDVHIFSGDDGVDPVPRGQPCPSEGAPALHYLFAALLVAATLALSLLLRALAHLPDLEVLFLLTVMVTAVWFGRGPSLLAAGLGVACYDLFFVPPYLTLSVSDRRYFLTFAMMFGVGFLISELAGRLRRQEQDAVAREDRTAVLFELTRELASTDQSSTIAAIAARHAVAVFGAKALVLEARPDGEVRVTGSTPRVVARVPSKVWLFVALGLMVAVLLFAARYQQRRALNYSIFWVVLNVFLIK